MLVRWAIAKGMCHAPPRETDSRHFYSKPRRAVMAPELKGEPSTLARICNNQRRSRKREYVAELKRRLYEYEDENRKLRELLHFAGVEQTLVSTHFNYSGGAPEVVASDNRMQTSLETALEDLSTNLVATANRASIPDPLRDLLAASFLQIPQDQFDLLFDSF
ncbi:hypothetical protein B0O99DRAFT_746218 [Bisporella sp. PMI_857]|nr:hypothetical protein B0O99DRAFT_746218 [Bisporella sp. PMI_857]